MMKKHGGMTTLRRAAPAFAACALALFAWSACARAQGVPGIRSILPDSESHYRVADTWASTDPAGLSLALAGFGHIDAARYADAESCLRPALEMGRDAQNPLVQAVAWFGLGRIHAARANYPAAFSSFATAESLLKTGTPEQRAYLARLYTAWAGALLDTDAPLAAVSFLDAASQLAAAMGEDRESAALDIQLQRVRVQDYFGRASDALGLLEDNLKRAVALEGPLAVRAARACMLISSIHARTGRPDDAWDYGYEALHIFESVLGKEHPETARAYAALGDLARTSGDFAYAAQLLQRAMDTQEELLGRQHPDHAATSAALAMLYLATDRYEHAVSALSHALEVDERALGARSLAAARDRHYLGITYRERMRLSLAADELTRALSLKQSLLGNAHPAVADLMADLAATLQLKGDADAALVLQKQALALDAAHASDIETDSANFNNVASLLFARGDAQAAVEHFEQALRVEREATDAAPLRMAAIYNNLASAHRAAGHTEAAASAFEEALKLIRWSLGLDNYMTADAFFNLAECRRELGDADEAEKNYKYFLRVTYPTDPRARAVRAWLEETGRLRETEPAPPKLPRFFGPQSTAHNEPDYIRGEQ